jgi:hypothetical protein
MLAGPPKNHACWNIDGDRLVSQAAPNANDVRVASAQMSLPPNVRVIHTTARLLAVARLAPSNAARRAASTAEFSWWGDTRDLLMPGCPVAVPASPW